jgi:RimJ/RimL family protein N-acetyltransferase
MGIFIGEPQYLSKGYGYYAVEQIKHIAFDEMNLVKIYLRVMTNNERGIHCYRNLVLK